jgi:hypothetical protein
MVPTINSTLKEMIVIKPKLLLNLLLKYLFIVYAIRVCHFCTLTMWLQVPITHNANGFVPFGKLIIVSLADEMIFWKIMYLFDGMLF